MKELNTFSKLVALKGTEYAACIRWRHDIPTTVGIHLMIPDVPSDWWEFLFFFSRRRLDPAGNVASIGREKVFSKKDLMSPWVNWKSNTNQTEPQTRVVTMVQNSRTAARGGFRGGGTGARAPPRNSWKKSENHKNTLEKRFLSSKIDAQWQKNFRLASLADCLYCFPPFSVKFSQNDLENWKFREFDVKISPFLFVYGYTRVRFYHLRPHYNTRNRCRGGGGSEIPCPPPPESESWIRHWRLLVEERGIGKSRRKGYRLVIRL